MAISEQLFEKDLISFDVIGNFLLFMLVFGMSATVSVRNMRAQLTNTKAILTGLFLQFVILPFVGFITVKILDMDKSMGIILLVVTSSPGGSYSNWFCATFNGDLALSVTMTTISTLFSIILLPANLILYANQAYDDDIVKALDWEALFLSLFLVISAIGLGLACSATIKSPSFQVIANKIGNFAGIALVIFSFTVCSSDTETDLIGRPSDFYVGIIMVICFALLLSNIIATILNVAKPERVTLSIECCYQNTGIATSIAITAFKGDALAIALGVPLFYGIMEAVILALYCIVAWKIGWTKAPSDAGFCTMITTNYELEEELKLATDEEKEPLVIKPTVVV